MKWGEKNAIYQMFVIEMFVAGPWLFSPFEAATLTVSGAKASRDLDAQSTTPPEIQPVPDLLVWVQGLEAT